MGVDIDNVFFSVTDEGVLSVDDSGKVTALAAGYATVRAEDIHGCVDKCYILVNDETSEFTVDGDISEWSDDQNTPKYAGYTLNDINDTGRSVTVYAVLFGEGIYFAGEAIHTDKNEGYSTWYFNTNFEVVVTKDSTTEQKWVSNTNNAAGTVGAFVTVTDGGMYRSTFELFIPYDVDGEITETTFARAGWAFKNRGESIKVERNGGTTTELTDWWWKDLKCPTNKSEHWYIYADGLHEDEKSTLPEGVFYTQNFDDTEDGKLPDKWEFIINPKETAEVRNGRLYLASVTNAPVVILHFVPKEADYAVEFDVSLESSGNATRWTGLVLDYRESFGYWQTVLRQNGNINVDWWNLVTKKFVYTHPFTTGFGTVEYNKTIAGSYPENTLEGYDRAYKTGAELFELDIYLSTDNHIVVMHDSTVDRTTDGTGKIEEMSLAQIKELNVDLYQGISEKVPTLAEVYELFADRDIVIQIEIKSGKAEIIPALKQLTESMGMLNKVAAFSSNFAQMKLIRELMPSVPAAVFVNDSLKGVPDDYIKMQRIATPNNYQVSRDWGNINVDFDYMYKVSARGMLSFMHSVNVHSVYDDFTVNLGADCILSDHPEWGSDFAHRIVAVPQRVESGTAFMPKAMYNGGLTLVGCGIERLDGKQTEVDDEKYIFTESTTVKYFYDYLRVADYDTHKEVLLYRIYSAPVMLEVY